MGQGITGTAAGTGMPLCICDVRKDPRYINAIDSVRSELAVPLVFQNEVIGVLDMQSRQPDYFTHEQQEILSAAGQPSGGGHRKRALCSSARAARPNTLLLLNEVGREASSILDVEELLRRAAELVKRVIDYQIMSIMLYDEPNQPLPAAAGREVRPEPQGRLTGSLRTKESSARRPPTEAPVRVPDVTRGTAAMCMRIRRRARNWRFP